MNKRICVLEDGRRVGFSLKRRKRDPNYLVRFRGPDGLSKERSTKEGNERRAEDAAAVIIRDTYAPKRLNPKITWDEAIELLEKDMVTGNRRRTTIDDYKINVGNLRKAFPKTKGPGQITPELAEEYKAIRINNGLAVDTVRGNLTTLTSIYGRWWTRTCKVLAANPFAEIDKPKSDRRLPRIVTCDEQQAFLTWLSERWDGWRFPILFLETKWLVGCRITELASATTEGLIDGRIRFEAETTKGRNQRVAKLPQQIFDELQAVCGKTFVFERFAERLRGVHIKRGKPNNARCVKAFSPKQLKVWIETEAKRYFDTHPEVKRFKLHNFRGTAMSRARMAGVSYDDASIAFGCHPETMRKHYLALNEESIADRVMDRIQNPSDPKSGEKSGEISPPPSSQPPTDNAA